MAATRYKLCYPWSSSSLLQRLCLLEVYDCCNRRVLWVLRGELGLHVTPSFLSILCASRGGRGLGGPSRGKPARDGSRRVGEAKLKPASCCLWVLAGVQGNVQCAEFQWGGLLSSLCSMSANWRDVKRRRGASHGTWQRICRTSNPTVFPLSYSKPALDSRTHYVKGLRPYSTSKAFSWGYVNSTSMHCPVPMLGPWLNLVSSGHLFSVRTVLSPNINLSAVSEVQVFTFTVCGFC